MRKQALGFVVVRETRQISPRARAGGRGKGDVLRGARFAAAQHRRAGQSDLLRGTQVASQPASQLAIHWSELHGLLLGGGQVLRRRRRRWCLRVISGGVVAFQRGGRTCLWFRHPGLGSRMKSTAGLVLDYDPKTVATIVKVLGRGRGVRSSLFDLV